MRSVEVKTNSSTGDTGVLRGEMNKTLSRAPVSNVSLFFSETLATR